MKTLKELQNQAFRHFVARIQSLIEEAIIQGENQVYIPRSGYSLEIEDELKKAGYEIIENKYGDKFINLIQK